MSEESVNSRRCKGGNLFFSRILFCICLCGPVAYALAEESTVVSEIRQNEKKSISGVVTDTNDEPLIGATVLVKGTQNGTVTDVDGRFHLKVNSGETLVVSYIGMKSKEVAVVDGKKELFIRLDADTEMLDEVLVTGYQTLSKERSTGAFSKVSTEKLELKRMDNLSSMLEGQVAGYVNGQIRGVTTMNAVANPMVVIDGFPVENTTLDRIGQTTENMPDLNPEDIESVTVLKDAAAASIYGSRAPFGVILVTTKKGKSGKASINYNNSFRISSPINMPEMMDSYTFANYFNSASHNNGGGDVFSLEVMQKMLDYQAGIDTDGVPASSNGQWGKPDFDPFTNAYANTDWYKELYKSQVFSQEHNVSINGGSDKVTYYASFNYLGQNGLLRHGSDGLKRYNATAKVNATLTDWLKFNYTMRFTRTDNYRPTNFNGGFYEKLGRQTWPNLVVYDPNGYYFRFFSV